MDIYKRLPADIKSKIFMYFEHPIVTLLNQENYIWIMNKLKSPPILSTMQRFNWAWILYHPLIRTRKRCGCYWYEQHLICCDGLEFEELEDWDPAVKATPLMQALNKRSIMHEIKRTLTAS